MSLKDQISTYVDDIFKKVGNPDKKKSNEGALLYEAYVFQELNARCEKEYKRAMKELTSSGLIASDDDLREKALGDHIVAESSHFSVLVKLSSPRKMFSKDDFIALASRKLKVKPSVLEALAEECMVDTKKSLAKKIVEVE